MELVFDNTLIYGVGLSGSLLLMALLPYVYIALKYACPLILEIGKLPPISRLTNLLSLWGLKHVIYPCLVGQPSVLSSWSRSDALLLAAYVAANLTCIFVDLPTVEKAGARAGTLALINMILLYLGPCLSFIADMLHIPLRAHRRLHACAGHIVWILTLFHAIIAVAAQGNLSLDQTRNIWPLIVSMPRVNPESATDLNG